jgi:hypothetical protein
VLVRDTDEGRFRWTVQVDPDKSMSYTATKLTAGLVREGADGEGSCAERVS